LLKEPKTPSSRRTLALPLFALEAMREHRKQQLAAGLVACPVFCSKDGKYLQRRNVGHMVSTIIDYARATGPLPIPERVRFHDLRHSHASILLSAGASLRAVSQRLGHSNAALNLRIYAHCLPGDDARLAEELQRRIG
jgi:integrase